MTKVFTLISKFNDYDALPGLSPLPQASISITSLFCTFLDQDEDNNGEGDDGDDCGNGKDDDGGEEEDLKIKNPIDINDDNDTDSNDGNDSDGHDNSDDDNGTGGDDDNDDDTFSCCKPGRRSPSGGRGEGGQPSTWRR